MFFLSTPFPHLLPFVLKGAWQIGKGLQEMHRKLWNTMNGAGTDPHPPQNITSSSIQRPRGGTAGAHNPLLLLSSFSQPERRHHAQRGAEQSKIRKQRQNKGQQKKTNTNIIKIGQVAKSSPIRGLPNSLKGPGFPAQVSV